MALWLNGWLERWQAGASLTNHSAIRLSGHSAIIEFLQQPTPKLQRIVLAEQPPGAAHRLHKGILTDQPLAEGRTFKLLLGEIQMH